MYAFESCNVAKYVLLFTQLLLQSILGLSTPVDIEVAFTNQDQRKHVDVKVDKDRRESYPVYLDGETVSGKVPEKHLSRRTLMVSFSCG